MINCSCSLQTLTRSCGDIQNDDPRPTTCTADASDTACCPSTSYCVYGGFCFGNDNDINTAELWDMTCDKDVGKWCPVGFDWVGAPYNQCQFQHAWGLNKYIIKNSSGDNIAKLDDNGFIVIKGFLYQKSWPFPSPDDEWAFVDESGTQEVKINMNTGNMYIRGILNYSQASITNNPFSNDFVLHNPLDVPQIMFDESGDIFTKKFLYQNSNP